MTEKKIDKKEKDALKEQELDQVTGGGAEMPAKPEDGNGPKKNFRWSHEMKPRKW